MSHTVTVIYWRKTLRCKKAHLSLTSHNLLTSKCSSAQIVNTDLTQDETFMNSWCFEMLGKTQTTCPWPIWAWHIQQLMVLLRCRTLLIKVMLPWGGFNAPLPSLLSTWMMIHVGFNVISMFCSSALPDKKPVDSYRNMVTASTEHISELHAFPHIRAENGCFYRQFRIRIYLYGSSKVWVKPLTLQNIDLPLVNISLKYEHVIAVERNLFTVFLSDQLQQQSDTK